jgi:hypothetical protein
MGEALLPSFMLANWESRIILFVISGMLALGRAAPGERARPALETDSLGNLGRELEGGRFFQFSLAQPIGKSRFGKENAKESKGSYFEFV